MGTVLLALPARPPTTPDDALVWICVIVFAVTAGLTLVGIIEKPALLVISQKWLKPLYGALLLEIVAVCVTSFRRHMLRGDTSPSIIETIRLAKRATPADYIRLFLMRRDEAGPRFAGTLGRPGALRVFMSPTAFFRTPLTVGDALRLTGADYEVDRDLYIIRCQPSDAMSLDARLATWDTVCSLLRSNFPPPPACPATSDPDRAVCIAQQYASETSDRPTTQLAQMATVGSALLGTPGTRSFLKATFGISDRSFLGFGETVQEMEPGRDLSHVLEETIVPEYLVKNVHLTEGNCRCVKLAPYAMMQADLLSLNIFDDVPSANSCDRKRLH